MWNIFEKELKIVKHSKEAPIFLLIELTKKYIKVFWIFFFLIGFNFFENILVIKYVAKCEIFLLTLILCQCSTTQIWNKPHMLKKHKKSNKKCLKYNVFFVFFCYKKIIPIEKKSACYKALPSFKQPKTTSKINQKN